MLRLLFSALLLLSFFSCQPASSPENKKPLVLVSVAPYAHVVKKLAAEWVDVQTLIPPGANPHIYEASPREVELQQRAVLWIYLGESFDKKMRQFWLETHHPMRILDVTEGLELLSTTGECEEGRDLHVWTSPRLMRKQAQRIAAALIELLPDKQEHILENLTLFLKGLEELNLALTAQLGPKRDSCILVSHPAFAYFCQDYGLHQLSIETEGKDPRLHDMDRLLSRAQKEQIKVVIAEPQHSSKGAEAMATLLGTVIHVVDPYSENYDSVLLELARLISE